MGVFKVDWALDGPIPFTAEECRRAGTVHIGNTFAEIAASEQQNWDGRLPEKPFILLTQQSLFDSTRAPEGKHTGWAYCHVPNGSTADRTETIEKQVERFAPGFRERILAKHTMSPAQMEEYNPNYIGGDINGGVIDLGQLFTRPALRWSPYRASAKGLYLCSASTPPRRWGTWHVRLLCGKKGVEGCFWDRYTARIINYVIARRNDEATSKRCIRWICFAAHDRSRDAMTSL